MKKWFVQNGRLLVAIAVILAFCGVLPAMCEEKQAVEAASWGLHFSQEGTAPTGNATQAALEPYNARFLGNTEEKTLYLTFDCGYEAGYTGKILDTLAKHSCKAAFFVVGNYLETSPELVRRMADEGHLVGNHTYHHYDMTKLSSEETFRKELEDVSSLYETVTGCPMAKFYRPPQGIYSEENLRMAKDMGYQTVFWSLAYVDWLADDQPTAEEAFSKLLPRTHPGAIVLLHATSKTNAEILDELLTKWEDMGYRFGTLDEPTAEPF